MKVLYKDEEGFLAVMQVLKAAYIPEENLLELCGTEEDIALQMTEKEAKNVVRELYKEDKADVTAYLCVKEDMDDDDFFDDDDDDDEDDFIERMIDLDTGSRGARIVFRDDE